MNDTMDKQEYINVKDALGRLGGNRGLYTMLLKRFDGYEYLENLETSLQNGDMEKATHYAHSLKGVSANLSLGVVKDLVTELEQLLINGGDYQVCFSSLKDALKATMGEIEGF